MLISGFTFIKNAQILGYPFIESIKSVLPIVDEFVVNVGKSEDDTLSLVKKINDPKIKIIESDWNEKMTDKGYVYGQQKMIAQFNCNGKWAFYIEADEIYHEKEIFRIRDAVSEIDKNKIIEALAFNFIHFYGNTNTYLDSPGWYRSEVRIIRNNIRTYAPDGLFWLVLKTNKIARYPFAKKIAVTCYHYGWVRGEDQMNLKSEKVQKYWNKTHSNISYENIDPSILRLFEGQHPKIMQTLLSQSKGLFKTNPNYRISSKQKKHRFMKAIENIFKVDLSKRHFKLVK